MIQAHGPLIRIMHWSLVAALLVAWRSPALSDVVHIWSGYLCLALVAGRVVLGIAGKGHRVLYGPGAVRDYVRGLMRGTAPRYAGLNPLGGWMAVALLATTVVICVSGWMFTTDAYWGVEWVRATHEVATDILIALAVIHVAANFAMSIYHRENLFAAMWHGRKRGVERL